MNYYVTFGQKHPLSDGFVEIEAQDQAQARKAAFLILGNKWAFMYEKPPDLIRFPMGKIGHTIIAERYEEE